jgi:hypothetical protein
VDLTASKDVHLYADDDPSGNPGQRAHLIFQIEAHTTKGEVMSKQERMETKQEGKEDKVEAA